MVAMDMFVFVLFYCVSYIIHNTNATSVTLKKDNEVMNIMSSGVCLLLLIGTCHRLSTRDVFPFPLFVLSEKKDQCIVPEL